MAMRRSQKKKNSSQAHSAVPRYTREDLNAVGPIEDAVRGLKCERHANVGVTGGELIREREGVVNPEKRMCDDRHVGESRAGVVYSRKPLTILIYKSGRRTAHETFLDVHHHEKRCNLNGNTRRLRTGWGDESGKMNWEEGF
jgi:hypothetical protein